MIVSLSVLERLLCLNLLPAEDNVITLRLVRKMKDKLGFTDEELKLLDFKTVPAADGKSSTLWKNTVEPKEIEIGEKAQDLIVTKLKELNDKGKLTEQHLPLWEKFVEPLVLEEKK